MQRRFSLHRRRGVFYAQVWNDDLGKYQTARTTGAKTKSEASMVVLSWFEHGMPTGRTGTVRPVVEAVAVGTVLAQLRSVALTPEDAGRILKILQDRELIESGGIVKGSRGSETLVGFLTAFWTFETSAYVAEKRSHGQTLGRRRCLDALGRIKAHAAPYFGSKRLAEVTRADLAAWGVKLRDSGLMAKSVNNTVEPLTVALRWAYHNGILPDDPTRGLRRFSGEAKPRGILTLEEATALFRLPWKDERSRVGSMLAATTGLRSGEVLAVRVQDIGQDRLAVKHSWSQVDRLKSTKTNEERTVPLLPEVRAAMLALVAENPLGQDQDRFVFYSADPAKPMHADVLRIGLDTALLALSLPAEEDRKDTAKVREAEAAWKARGVVFHSWRHFYASRMSDVAEERVVRLATGHASSAMHEHYASHRTDAMLQQAADAAAQVFGSVLAFPGKQASA